MTSADWVTNYFCPYCGEVLCSETAEEHLCYAKELLESIQRDVEKPKSQQESEPAEELEQEERR